MGKRDIGIDVSIEGRYDKAKKKRYVLAKYSNGVKKRFSKGVKNHHKRTFSNTKEAKSSFVFRSRLRNLASREWLDEIIAKVTLDCYHSITAMAPVDTGRYRQHIKADMPNPSGSSYNFPINSKKGYSDVGGQTRFKGSGDSITYGSVYVEPEVLPNSDGKATYSDLARWLEFGTGPQEITGAGSQTVTREGEEVPYKGMAAQPHWIPNYEIAKRQFVMEVKRRLKKL